MGIQAFVFLSGTLATALMALTVGYGLYLHVRKDGSPLARKRARWILGVDGAALVALCVGAVVLILLPGDALAQQAAPAAGISTGEGIRKGLGYLGAGLATGCAAIGAGIGVGIAGAAGIGAISEKPSMLGKSLIYVGLAEGVAIYGLLISFMILARV